MNELTQSIKTLRKNGEKLAAAERDYKITLATEALRLHAEKMPVSLINLVIYGLEPVAGLRERRDIAQAMYEANKEHINTVKLRLRILEAQLSREWSAAGKGDI